MKKNLILILIAIILKSFLANIPIASIAACILLIIACLNLRKITNNKSYFIILIFTIISTCMDLIIGIMSASSLLKNSYDLLSFLSNQYIDNDIFADEQFLSLYSSLFNSISKILYIAIIPIILWSLILFKLGKALSDLSSNDLLKASLQTNSKKTAIFTLISSIIGIAFVIVFFNVFINEIMKLSTQEVFTPTYLIPLVLISIFVIMPLLIVFAILLLIFNIKFVVNIFKLIKEAKNNDYINQETINGEL